MAPKSIKALMTLQIHIKKKSEKSKLSQIDFQKSNDIKTNKIDSKIDFSSIGGIINFYLKLLEKKFEKFRLNFHLTLRT